MKLPKFNNWAFLGIFLMFGMSVAEAFESPLAATIALLMALCAFGMWLYTARKAR